MGFQFFSWNTVGALHKAIIRIINVINNNNYVITSCCLETALQSCCSKRCYENLVLVSLL